MGLWDLEGFRVYTMEKIDKITIRPDQKPSEEQIKRLRESKKYPLVFDDESPEYTLSELKEMQDAAVEKQAGK